MLEVPRLQSTDEDKSYDIPEWWGTSTGLLTAFQTEIERIINKDKLPEEKESMFLKNTEFIERYEINNYADAIILYNNRYDQYLYYIDEPELGVYDSLLKETKQTLDQELPYTKEVPDTREEKIELTRKRALQFLENKDKTTQLQNRFFEILSRISPSLENFQKEIDEEMIDLILYYIERDLVLTGSIEPLMGDNYIEDIMINKPNSPAYIYHSKYGQGGNIMTNISFKKEELNNLAQKLVQRAGKTVSSAKPIADGSLAGGERINVNYGSEITYKGTNITIRRFDEEPLTPPQLIKYGTFNASQMAFSWLGVENKKSFMFAGGTGAGKTTTLNCISMFIPDKYKIVSIEDTREVQLPHTNWIEKITREQEGEALELGFEELLEDSLRQRPDYIMMGEVRGDEAQDLFQAMNTGHASVSTYHATDPQAAIKRLAEDQNVSRQKMDALDVISVQKKFVRDDGDERRVINMGEIEQITNDNNVEIVQLYDYDAREDEFDKLFDGESSSVLEDIMNTNGWTEEELLQELEDRKMILETMIEEEIYDYEEVTLVVQRYMRNKEEIMKIVESGSLKEYTQVIDYD